MQVITSKDNEIVKNIKKLKDKKYRDEAGLYVIEGIKIIEEAISYSVAIIGQDVIDDINILKILDESNNYFGNLGYNKKYSIKTIKYTNALLDRIDDDNHNYCYVEKDDINVKHVVKLKCIL